MRDGEQPLRNKSRGRIVHVSDFVLEECGFLRLDEHEISQQLKLPEAPKPPATSSSRSFEGTDWIPPPPPAPFTSYRLASFDARRIIYPGVKHDAWWDMPQLIAQVGHLACAGQLAHYVFRRRMPLRFSRPSSQTALRSLSTIARLPTQRLPLMPCLPTR